MPIICNSAEPVSRKITRDREGDAEHVIGIRVARAGGSGRILRDTAVETPLSFIYPAVGKQRHPVAELAAELENVFALDGGEVVAKRPGLQILSLRALIEGRPAERSVTAPSEIRE